MSKRGAESGLGGPRKHGVQRTLQSKVNAIARSMNTVKNSNEFHGRMVFYAKFWKLREEYGRNRKLDPGSEALDSSISSLSQQLAEHHRSEVRALITKVDESCAAKTKAEAVYKRGLPYSVKPEVDEFDPTPRGHFLRNVTKEVCMSYDARRKEDEKYQEKLSQSTKDELGRVVAAFAAVEEARRMLKSINLRDQRVV